MAQRGQVRRPGRHVPAAGLGVLAGAMVVAPLLPIVAFNYWLNSRVLYSSVPGLALAVCAAISRGADRSGSPVHERVRVRGVVAGVSAAVLLGMALAMVGVQCGYQRRDGLDRDAVW